MLAPAVCMEYSIINKINTIINLIDYSNKYEVIHLSCLFNTFISENKL